MNNEVEITRIYACKNIVLLGIVPYSNNHLYKIDTNATANGERPLNGGALLISPGTKTFSEWHQWRMGEAYEKHGRQCTMMTSLPMGSSEGFDECQE